MNFSTISKVGIFMVEHEEKPIEIYLNGRRLQPPKKEEPIIEAAPKRKRTKAIPFMAPPPEFANVAVPLSKPAMLIRRKEEPNV